MGNTTKAILTRESDGLRFEPTLRPGFVLCEACFTLVEPSKVREHRCTDIFKPMTPSLLLLRTGRR